MTRAISWLLPKNREILFLCDGKERPIERPKKKNVKHLAFTGKVLDKDCFKSNKGLRIALAVFRDTADKERN